MRTRPTSSAASSTWPTPLRPESSKGVDLDRYRSDRLVGTVDQVREQVGVWGALGIETLILGTGVVPFQVSGLDEIEMLAAACG